MDVRYRVGSGKHLLAASISGFDREPVDVKTFGRRSKRHFFDRSGHQANRHLLLGAIFRTPIKLTTSCCVLPNDVQRLYHRSEQWMLFQKDGVTLMIRPLLLSVLTCTLLLWNVAARAETKPSPNATVKCGRFAGLKDLPGWETPAIYKIEGNKVTFERVLTSGDETQAWSGVKGQSGQIMLVGEGGNKSDQWVMEFSGKWAGENKTKLTGRFINTSGSTGYRICTINLR